MVLAFRRRSAGLRALPTSQLNAGQIVSVTLYHETGTAVLAQGQTVCAEHLRALEAAKIKDLYECKSEDDLMALIESTQKCACPVSSLPVGTPLPYNIYDRGDRFLLRKGGVLASAQHQAMSQQMENVYINEACQLRTLQRYDLELVRTRTEKLEAAFKDSDEFTIKGGECLLPALQARQPSMPRPAEHVRSARRTRNDQVNRTGELLASLRQEKDVDLTQVGSVVTVLSEELQSDVGLAIGLSSEASDPNAYQQHSTKVATLAMGVGVALGIPAALLKELGMAALLHEVGMFGVDPAVLHKRGGLTEDERQQLQGHPIVALKYLERVRGVSSRTALAVYQEHECPDRSGYPNQRPAFLVHDFAKIIAICDTYEAMISPRPFRERILPYRAMEQLIFLTAKMRYDPRIMRAMLQLVGLFPVGSWVQLSNKCHGRVISNNTEKYDRPVIALLCDANKLPLGDTKVVNLASEPGLQIQDVVDDAHFPELAEAAF